MGLTWIDYDTIEKPIEEITVGTGEAKDIEFTVETLKCNSSELKKQGNGLTKKVCLFVCLRGSEALPIEYTN